MKNLNVLKIPIEQIKNADYNPRKDLKPGDKEYQELKTSIEKFGYVSPIIWNKRTQNIVGGHQRFKILKNMGHKEIDVVVIDIDEAEEKALNITLNKVKGEWDEIKLDKVLKELDEIDFDIDFLGFEFEEEDNKEIEIKEKEIIPYKKVHYLISADINLNDYILETIEVLREKEGVEIESSYN